MASLPVRHKSTFVFVDFQWLTHKGIAFADLADFQRSGPFLAWASHWQVLGQGERWTNGWQFQIQEMCVHADYQRQGAGAKLLSECEKSLALQGFSGITRQTGRQAPARIFYESRCYQPRSLFTLSKLLRAIG